MSGPNPYRSLGTKQFWRTAVSDKNPFNINELWAPKANLGRGDRVITAGSCFAQHIGRALKSRDYGWLDAEPAPPMLSAEQARAFNFGVFSFRTGNIYTAAGLLQWVTWALGHAPAPDEIWHDGDRFFDPHRPAIEPNGFSSAAEVINTREATLGAIRNALAMADLFVFTLGLTEAWVNSLSGITYPVCPGTLAGDFDPSVHVFHNFQYPEIFAQMTKVMDICREFNPKLRFLLTVSPVPLTATAQPDAHVLPATVYSKSTLRAVAGDLCTARADTDYFPSYEIITAPAFRGVFYEPNMRNVGQHGVDFVMNQFFDCLKNYFGNDSVAASDVSTLQIVEQDLVCEEEHLEKLNQSRGD